MRVAVIGASGFVGSAVHKALVQRQVEVVTVRGPRIACAVRSVDDIRMFAERNRAMVDLMAEKLAGCTMVVNACGIADATSASHSALFGANAAAPEVVRRAARVAGVDRMVHVSSAAAQGRTTCLDESQSLQPFSLYSRSKALGEWGLRAKGGGPHVVVYRPTSVHGQDRPVTQKLARLARSKLSSVAGDGRRPTPQTLVGNVGDACAFIATYPACPPDTVLHPWEGLTTERLLELLSGGKSPRHIPHGVARAVLGGLFRVASARPALTGHARRLELMWFGQPQSGSWLSDVGWAGPVGLQQWKELGRLLPFAGGRKAHG